MSGRFDFEFSFTQSQHRDGIRRSEQTSGCILILGNFQGGKEEDTAPKPISKRSLDALNIDTFDSVLASIKPQIHLDDFVIQVADLDDFHPDALYQKLEVFRPLRDLRRRLLDPATFSAAATELMSLVPDMVQADAANDLSLEQGVDKENDSDALERLLGRSSSIGRDSHSRQSPPEPRAVDLTSLIRSRLAPYIVPDADPRQDILVESLDAALQSLMRSILHAPAFQAVESAWRGLDWNVREAEADEGVELLICNLTKTELLADLRGSADHLEESEFYRLVVDQETNTPGGRNWSLLLGDYYFDHSEDDVFLLAALGAIASMAGAPFVAGAKPQILGCHSVAGLSDQSKWLVDDTADQKRWADLRSSSQAKWLGLALPRVLLRLPYGPQTDEVETMSFEEFTENPTPESLLWGNAIYAYSLLVGRTLGPLGQSTHPESLTIDQLPAYVYKQHGNSVLMPCAEVLLSEQVGRSMLERGLMPVLGHKGRNMVSFYRLQSLANPPVPLGG